MISHEHKCIFIHIPKTAGGSIERALTGYGWALIQKNNIKVQHIDCIDTKSIYPNCFNDYYKFAFVRNPWDLIVSTYFWFQERNEVQVDFKYFIENIEDYNKQLMFLPHKYYASQQLNHLTDKDGNVMVDFIGRFEDLQKDFNQVCSAIGVHEEELPISNTTNHKHYTEYYDSETQGIVERFYEKDIEYFGYEFKENHL